MGREKVKKGVIALYALIVLLLVIIGICILTLFVARVSNENEVEYSDYKYTRFDPLTRQRKDGIITIPTISDDRNFISYEEDDSYVLISEFGSTEYECTGKCYCENMDVGNNDNRRGGSSLPFSLSRPLIYLVAATSAAIAINHARGYFEDECRRVLYEDGCSDSHVQSVVETCIEYPHKEEMGQEDFKEFTKDSEIYWCRGKCMPNIYFQDYPVERSLRKLYKNEYSNHMACLNDLEFLFAKNFGCESMEYETEVWVDLTHYNDDIPEQKKLSNPQMRLKYIKNRFLDHYLEPYCVRNSIKDLPAFECGFHVTSMPEDCFYKAAEKGISYAEVCIEDECHHAIPIENSKPMCVAHDNKGKHRINKSLVCVRLDDRTDEFQDQMRKNEN